MKETTAKIINRSFPLPVTRTILIWLGFGVYIAAVYGNLLTGWWGWDDSQTLKHAYQYSPLEYFFVPEIGKKFQPANFTPWIIFSFDLDLALFGLNPGAFYAHHLFALWLVAGGTYIFLRLWLNELWSVAGVLLFICSAPVTTLVHQLMLRHYLEGLLFSIIILYLYTQALRRDRPLLAWLGALFYLFAASAKEVYVVQALFLPLIPEQNLRRRLSLATPFFLALGIYVLWRRFILGKWVGGYGPSIDWSAVYHMILKIPSFLFGNTILSTASILVLSALMIYTAWRNVSARILIAGAVLLLLGPIVPAILISDPQRLLIFFVWALSVGVVLSLGTVVASGVWRQVIALGILFVIGFGIASQGLKVRSGLEDTADGFAAHGRFIMQAGDNQVLLPSIRFGNWFATGLLWLRKNMFEEQPPIMVYDEIDMAELNKDSLRFFRYEESCRCLKDVTAQIPHIYKEWKENLREKPLSVKFDYADGMLYWQLGPYKKGKYSVITYGRSGSKLRLPLSGVQRTEISEPIFFRVRYDSPDGWTTYSPLLQFDGNKLIRKS